MKNKILYLDIETAPLEVYTWSLFQDSIPLNMIKKDWFILSWSAKWDHEKTIMYMDQRNAKDIANDKRLVTGIHKLMCQATHIVWQNGDRFDRKKLNARFAINGLLPPSKYVAYDTYRIARNAMALTSNKLEYMANIFNKKYKKLTSKGRKYTGFDLWAECLKGNKSAWREMEKYNKRDVLALEELFGVLKNWDSKINLGLTGGALGGCPRCGSNNLQKNGFKYLSGGTYQRYICKSCGMTCRDKVNLMPISDRKKIKVMA